MMKKLFTAFILTLAMPGIAQNFFGSFFSNTEEGVTYFLPDTKINITVEARCITQTPGEFYSYAERFLHIKGGITEAGNRWEMTGIESDSEGIPCKEKTYTISISNSSASNIGLTGKGIIETINTIAPEKEGKQQVARPYGSERVDATQYMTEEMLTATSTAKMAELTAKEIYAIRESKLAITRGQAENMPSDGAAIALLLQELDKQERALTEMFIGRTDTVYHQYQYSIAPNEICDTSKAVLFRFSHKIGVVDKENLAGEPVYFNIKDLKTVARPIADESAKKKAAKQDGICYNIPGRIRLEVYTRTRRFIEKEIAVAQLGIVETLSKSYFSKNNGVKVLFDTATGGIISIKRD